MNFYKGKTRAQDVRWTSALCGPKWSVERKILICKKEAIVSRIVFHESYIVVIPTYNKTDSHKHPFMHIFFGENRCKIMADKKEIQGNIILLKSNVKHTINENNNCDFILLIEPTSTIAEQFLDKYMCDSYYHTITECVEDIPKDLINLSDKEILNIVKNIFLNMGVSMECTSSKDERIEQITLKIISGEWLKYSVKEIAKAVFLSESRLTHLFKEEVGISLKSYILIRRMEHAYKFVSSGGKVTQAAMESGFASSAHLAYTCKSLTGISITEVLKSSKK